MATGWRSSNRDSCSEVISALKWFLVGLLFILWGLTLLPLSFFFKAKDLFGYSQFVFRVMFKIFRIRVVFKGKENLPIGRGVIYMVNHNSVLDHFALVCGLDHFVVGIEKRENFRIPVYGQLARWWGNIPINRSDTAGAIESIRSAEKVLAQGVGIGIAPEGTRSKDGKLQPFKKGGFHLAKNAKALIVPVSIVGMNRVNPDRAFLIRPGSVKIIFHPPVESGDLEVDDLVAIVRDRISRPVLK